MTKVLLGFLMSMYGQLPDEVARYNAYLTLHMEGVYGAKVSCEPFSEDPNNPYLYRCTVNNDEAYIRLYCESNEAGPFLCRNHFIIPKK